MTSGQPDAASSAVVLALRILDARAARCRGSLRDLRGRAARASRPTSGAHDLLADLHAAGVPVVIVANSAADAAQAYLERWDVVRFFRHIVGRPEFQPDLMRPNIHTVELAISLAEAHPAGTVMIGDSVSDVQASHAAGTGVIGYTKNYLRGVALAKAGADTLTKDIDSLVL